MALTGMATSSSALFRSLARGPLLLRQLSLGSSLANKVRNKLQSLEQLLLQSIWLI